MIQHKHSYDLVPYLSIAGADQAIEFYRLVFGVEPFVRLDLPDGRVMHCEFRFGNVRFFLSDELPEHGGTPSPKTKGATTVALHLYVEDCDKTTTLMEQNGSEILMEPKDMFWGERFARVRDPFGHEWGVATVICEMSPTEIENAANKMFDEISQTEDKSSA